MGRIYVGTFSKNVLSKRVEFIRNLLKHSLVPKIVFIKQTYLLKRKKKMSQRLNNQSKHPKSRILFLNVQTLNNLWVEFSKWTTIIVGQAAQNMKLACGMPPPLWIVARKASAHITHWTKSRSSQVESSQPSCATWHCLHPVQLTYHHS